MRPRTRPPLLTYLLLVTTLTQPEGELLPGLPTLLTMHGVNAEVKRTQNKPKRLNNPTLTHKRRKHEHPLLLCTCEQKGR